MTLLIFPATIERGTAGPPDETAAHDPSPELDGFATHLAELSAHAPTVMDTRVCRGVAVQSRSFSDAFRGQRDDPAPPDARERARSLYDRRTEFEVALRDLAEHVELL